MGSDVVVHLELVRVRTQTDRVHLVGPLVVDPCLDEIGGENSAGLEELVVLLESIEFPALVEISDTWETIENDGLVSTRWFS